MAGTDYLSTYDYKPKKGFYSNTTQINHHMDLFREANKKAINENTEAIQEQTNRLEAIISAQTVEYKVEAAMTRENYNEQQETNRSMFGRFIDAIVGLFSNDRNNNGKLDSGYTTYYELAVQENQNLRNSLSSNTQAIIQSLEEENRKLRGQLSAGTNDIASEISAGTRNISAQISGGTKSITGQMSADTNTLKNALSSIETDIENIRNAITANTAGDVTNTNTIKTSLDNIRNTLNNTHWS